MGILKSYKKARWTSTQPLNSRGKLKYFLVFRFKTKRLVLYEGYFLQCRKATLFNLNFTTLNLGH